jgi:type I restriction enzyme M protein
MINKENLKSVLKSLNFKEDGKIYSKKFDQFDCLLKVDFNKGIIIYPEHRGLKINERQTCNLKSNENFVVLECVNRLLEKGYNPKHIELEPKWKVGHGASGGRADILVKDYSDKALLIIECKNAGTEFKKHWEETLENGSQLFGYAQQEGNVKFISLYASDFIDKKVVSNYYLITLVDNEQYLEDNTNLLAFKDAKIREEIFNVWKDTYLKDYTTKGLFEKDVQAYKIGKKNYTIEDLSLVDSITKQSKYHEFATILRKYSVSGRENAFDKLVNLFLCKIVDEKYNQKDLQFYWKGIAYDTPFKIQDRLQKLYKVGMGEFLKEEVTYIDNKQIDQAFWAFKNDPDETRETIKGYFKQLKFFTNNDFAFIDVHNKRLFYENAHVLIDIVRLFQDTKIKSNTKNQFLGDMFENFLDGGVKQSEGQFFTPMPITRFIIQSLPIKTIISDSKKPPKAIDYACGSGHFLNELASQMRPFIEATKDTQIEDYHKEIYGIEKEYRLSKVAKVSAYMYGQDNINLTYADALSKNEKFKNSSFKILVANPPYAVKGFLSTLDQDSKDTYTLLNTIDSKAIQTNNSIECFFIERAKQLLEADGVGAIIVPSSVLSNADTTYQETRSILLKYFSIVAIAEFGSGTFGKTGTNTVTLFIKRRNENPEKSKHYKNRINSWFAKDTKKQKVFEDEHYIISYCQHLEYDFDDYKTLLKGKPNDNLLKTEMFEDYKKAFDILTSTKNKKKQTNFKKLSQSKKEEELTELFYIYLFEIEKEKLYYFTLASTNQNKVVIVKAPTDNKASKKFLGYEWSTAKGNEGIKLYTDDENKHITPLYDETNRNNQEKINYYIQQAFESKTSEIPEDLASFVNYSSLINMLDFKRTDFNKQIALTPKNFNPIISQYKSYKLSALFDEIKNGKNVNQNDSKGKFRVTRIETIADETINLNATKWTNDTIKKEDFLISGDILFSHINSVKHLAKTAIVTDELDLAHGINLLRFRANKKKIIPNYAYQIFNLPEFKNEIKAQAQKAVNQASVNSTYLKELKIPLPPNKIQTKIVKECQVIDQEKEKAVQSAEKGKTEIEKLVSDAVGKGKKEKISTLFEINPNTYNPTTKPDDTFTYVDIDAVGKGTGIISYNNKVLGKDAPSRARRIAEKGNFIISSVRPYLKGFAYIDKDVSDCVFSTGFFVLNSKDEKVILNKIMFYAFMYFEPLMKQIEAKMGKGQYPSINKTDLDNLTISVININDQKKIIKSIEKQEKEIEKSREIINGIAERKQMVLTKYL